MNTSNENTTYHKQRLEAVLFAVIGVLFLVAIIGVFAFSGNSRANASDGEIRGNLTSKLSYELVADDKSDTLVLAVSSRAGEVCDVACVQLTDADEKPVKASSYEGVIKVESSKQLSWQETFYVVVDTQTGERYAIVTGSGADSQHVDVTKITN